MFTKQKFPVKWFILLAILALFIAYTNSAEAHVKWFSNFDFADPPRSVMEILNPTVIGLAVFAAVVIGGLVPLDLTLAKVGWYQRINDWLESYSNQALLIIRVGTGAVMLMVWQADALLAPELVLFAPWLGWAQFAIALLLIFKRTTPIAGAGVLALYGLAIYEYGLFHMLDYAHYAGVGFFLLICNINNEWIRGLGLPALYSTVGFSLAWLAVEKLVYPEWGLYILSDNPELTLGLPPSFFLTGAAFVELSLGFLLIICLLQRPLALVITFVFFSTTALFGKTEVIGHTLIHAALIVFLVEGPGRIYKAPITFHKQTPLRIAFASVNFLLMVGVILFAYSYSANQQYLAYIAERPLVEAHDALEVSVPPRVDMIVHESETGGWNIQLATENFEFVPPQEEYREGEGYATLFIDGEEVTRLYSEWYYLPNLRPGSYQLSVILNGADGGRYTIDGNPIVVMEQLEVTP